MRRIPYSLAKFHIRLSSPASAEEALPPSSEAKCDAQRCPWWPYSNSKDFKTNTALIIVVLLCALICGLAFNAAIRYAIRMHCRRRRQQREEANRKAEVEGGAEERDAEIPGMIYSEGMKLAGEEAECIICLSEFAIGEKIRVLEECQHGFHVQCIQQWLVSRSSCPTCRSMCSLKSSSSSSPPPPL